MDQLHCANCGTENLPSANFCDGCGQALLRTCASCGAVARASASFCLECGSALTGPKGDDQPGGTGAPLPAPGGPLPGAVSERRVCSVLFCDLVGFTSQPFSAVGEAVGSLREVGNPYQLAHGLVDYAEVLARAGEEGVAEAVTEALAEAKSIAEKLGCSPLVARAEAVGSLYARTDARG